MIRWKYTNECDKNNSCVSVKKNCYLNFYPLNLHFCLKWITDDIFIRRRTSFSQVMMKYVWKFWKFTFYIFFAQGTYWNWWQKHHLDLLTEKLWNSTLNGSRQCNRKKWDLLSEAINTPKLIHKFKQKFSDWVREKKLYRSGLCWWSRFTRDFATFKSNYLSKRFEISKFKKIWVNQLQSFRYVL